MANLILTTKCNKGCSYCFAKQNSFLDPQEMSLAFAKQIIDDAPLNCPIKLMGGEPTQYPYILDLADYIISKKRTLIFLSNLLFSQKILDYLIEKAKSGATISVLANGTDLENESKRKLFINNFIKLSNLKKEGLNVSIQLGLTIDPNKTKKYHKIYTRLLLKELHPTQGIRLSLAFPDGKKTKDLTNIILNNKRYGEIIMAVVNECRQYVFYFDCIVLPCLFSKKDLLLLLLLSIQGKIAVEHPLQFICKGTPTDIYPNGKSIPCYPASGIEIPYQKEAQWTSDELSNLKKIVSTQIDTPSTCTKCFYLKNGFCRGPCLGFFDLGEATKCLSS